MTYDATSSSCYILPELCEKNNCPSFNLHFLFTRSTCIQGGIVRKEWEPGDPAPGPFLAKIRKVDQN